MWTRRLARGMWGLSLARSGIASIFVMCHTPPCVRRTWLASSSTLRLRRPSAPLPSCQMSWALQLGSQLAFLRQLTSSIVKSQVSSSKQVSSTRSKQCLHLTARRLSPSSSRTTSCGITQSIYLQEQRMSISDSTPEIIWCVQVCAKLVTRDCRGIAACPPSRSPVLTLPSHSLSFPSRPLPSFPSLP